MTDSSRTRARLEACYLFIVAYVKRYQRPPAVRDFVRARVGEDTPEGPITSPSIVRNYLIKLEEQGLIQLAEPTGDATRRASRGIRLPGARMIVLGEEQWELLEESLKRAHRVWPARSVEIERIREEIFQQPE